jgi:hypothetical protein
MCGENRYTCRRMEPAQTIIKKLGGPSAVAEIVGRHRTRVSSWQRPRASGGTDGRVPQEHIETLLEHAKKRSIALRLSDFFAKPRSKSPRSKSSGRSRAA